MAFARRENSYYQATAAPAPRRSALRGAVDCDVCVVGGGIAGCSTALHLAERGYRVVLLEAHRIGWGGSGRAGGQALPGTAAGPSKIGQLIGPSAARAVWDISVEGLELVRTLIARHDIACDWVSGQMQVAVTPRHDRELHEILRECEEDYDYRSVRYVPRDEVCEVLATTRYIAAVEDSNAGHLHSLNYTLGLAAAAERLGARVFEDTRALEFASGSAVTVRTTEGSVRCGHLALCGNASLGATAPALQSKIMPVGSCIVATAPLGAERAGRLIANRAAVADMNWVLDYFRLTADHRLLFGGRVTYSGFDPSRIAATTRHRLVKVFPQLADVPVEYAWGGYIDITLNRAPHFGRLAPNVYFLQGFSGHGIALAGIGGKLLAEAVAGQAERFDVFARIPHTDFPGGALLRRPALVLAMLYYRVKDLLG
ncbi:MAG TPA: FAD-binding oxidoreductase [Steroidobacteraceae bacterium]|nr:FAD-binding oxidoreductase [Steroidobacteraceae bacterium]